MISPNEHLGMKFVLLETAAVSMTDTWSCRVLVAWELRVSSDVCRNSIRAHHPSLPSPIISTVRTSKIPCRPSSRRGQKRELSNHAMVSHKTSRLPHCQLSGCRVGQRAHRRPSRLLPTDALNTSNWKSGIAQCNKAIKSIPSGPRYHIVLVSANLTAGRPRDPSSLCRAVSVLSRSSHSTTSRTTRRTKPPNSPPSSSHWGWIMRTRFGTCASS
jgi:hypothetical protein